MIRKNKRKSKRSNPAWLDKLLGKTSIAKDSINITVNDGVISLKGRKYVELGKELNDLLENTAKDLSIEFHPIDKKGKVYKLNRIVYDDSEDDSDLETVRRAIRNKSRRGSFDRLPTAR